jgi:hypothetical protein
MADRCNRGADDRSRRGVTIELLSSIPGFGKVLVDASNEGRGFRAPRDAKVTIELGPELTGSPLFEVREWVE